MSKPGRTSFVSEWFSRTFCSFAAKIAAQVEKRLLADRTSTPFSVHGDSVDTDLFRSGAGMSFVMTHGRSGFFYYERLISRERYTQNSLAPGIRLEF
jgi:hypothetical protein